jgi:hypothetical protein
MRKDKDRPTCEGPTGRDALIHFLAGSFEEVEFLCQPIGKFAFDVDEPGIDIASYDPILRHRRCSFPMVD